MEKNHFETNCVKELILLFKHQNYYMAFNKLNYRGFQWCEWIFS